jgi:SAM-dependent MidA family methyltransferase
LQQLIEKILVEIRNYGSISFARFMECALYCPVYGYYEKEEDTPGRRGDYYTSVSVGSLFGELLALQFADWLAQMDATAQEIPCRLRAAADGGQFLGARASRRRVAHPAAKKLAGETPELPGRPLQIVEAGAHKGALARDILIWLRAKRPVLCESIQYCIVEPSDRRQDWQRRTLVEFLSQVRWAKSLSELTGSIPAPGAVQNQRPVCGIIFSNELLDAMPVHRLGWDAKRSVWFEWGVTFCNGRFQWTRLKEEQSEIPLRDLAPDADLQFQPPVSPGACSWPPELLRALPDGFILEVCPEANRWWAQAAAMLESGKLLTIDYGLSEEELLLPERAGGTLRAYHRHRLSADVLTNPGAQDITAHVNFSALRQAGEGAGLKTEALVTQEQFLTRIASTVFNQKTQFGEWTPERSRQFRTLTHPNHLGHVFRVLVQSR